MGKLRICYLALLWIPLTLSIKGVAPIRISTEKIDLILQVNDKGRLYQTYFGNKLVNNSDIEKLSGIVNWHEAYIGSGCEDYFEPAIAITHNDGNMSTCLYFKDVKKNTYSSYTETIITLADNNYPVNVVLHYIAYYKENVIKIWSEIIHKEKKPVTLWRMGSTMLYIENNDFYLTNYHGDWACEGKPDVQQLKFGKKIIDTKLGSRAAMFSEPFFELGIGKPAEENEGNVMLGTIGWTGNFSCTFEIDNFGVLRIIPAINSYASNYILKPDDKFVTPEFIFTISDKGISEASRNFHDWARKYQLKDGEGNRMTLLNNWENTGFNFNESKLVELIKDAKDLGVDMFLLDDGWFANKYPRNDDKAGLGDWECNKTKLPNGISTLTDAAKSNGIKFGLWIEPEMVNPKSELFEKHPDWAITLPNRDTYYFRHQLVLDLSNPKVQQYVFDIIDKILTENPDIAYLKWDCNSPITNIYSHYLKNEQQNLYIDYVRGLYNIFNKVNKKYPKTQMMLCSGGGARCDYEALKFFTEFWCSDNTDPIERIYIQWGLSKFFPVKAMAAHVTNWKSSVPLKFRIDVASMCKLGFDINMRGMNDQDFNFCKSAVKNYNQLKPAILEGDQYRLVSPYSGNHAAVDYVSMDKSLAVLFVYDIHPRYNETIANVKLQGLDEKSLYKVTEINTLSGDNIDIGVFSGDILMKVGLRVFSDSETKSRVIKFVKL